MQEKLRMVRRYGQLPAIGFFFLAGGLQSLEAQPEREGDLTALQEQAMRAAVLRVAPSMAQIETSGGVDVIGSGREQTRKGIGPTTGLVATADGYLISS